MTAIQNASVTAEIKPLPYLHPPVVAFDLSPTPEGRSRCRHDMLDGECSWCLGIDERVAYQW